MKKTKVLFIYRHPHEVHAAFAKSISADFVKSGPDWFPPPLYFITSLFKLIKNPGLIKYDALYIEGMTGLYLTYWIKKFNKNIKTVYLDADPFFYRDVKKYSGIKKKLISILLNTIDGIITDSYHSKSFVEKHIRKPIRVVHPFIDTKKFSNVKADLDSKKIVFVGRLHPEKNLAKLLDAFKIVKSKYPSSELVIIGDGPLRKQLEDEATEGIKLTGFNKTPEKSMNGASIGVLVSDFEAYGVAAVEYAAAGLIPIISDRAGAKEILSEKSIIANPDSVKDIADKILRIFNMDIEKKKKLQEKLRKTALNNNSRNGLSEFKSNFYQILNEIS